MASLHTSASADKPSVIEIPDSENDSDGGYSSSELPSLNEVLSQRYPKLTPLLATPSATAGSVSAGAVSPTPSRQFLRTTKVTATTATTTKTATNERIGGYESVLESGNGDESSSVGKGAVDAAPQPPNRGRSKKTTDSVPAKPRARKAQASEAADPGQQEGAKKPRQRRTTKAADDKDASSATLPKKTAAARVRKKPEATSKYFATPTPDSTVSTESAELRNQPPKQARDTPEPRTITRANTHEPLNLEPIVQRKMDWTPPRTQATTTTIAAVADSSDVVCLSSDSILDPVRGNADIFKTLGEQFSCSVSTPGSTSSGTSSLNLGKRKLIQLVPTNGAGEPVVGLENKSPAKKRAAPRKKARTLTELATEAYRVREDEGGEGEGDSMSIDKSAPSKAPQKRQRKSTGQKPAKPRKRPSTPPPVLLSPSAAMEQASRQAFVFGTSSQLVREEDPDTLRAIQEAIHLSAIEEQANDSQRSLSLDLRNDPYAQPVINSDAIEPADVRPRLWDIGARDEEGSLLHPGVEDPVPGPLESMDDPFGYMAAARDVVMSEADDTFGNPFESNNVSPQSPKLDPCSPSPLPNGSVVEISDSFVDNKQAGATGPAPGGSPASLESFFIDDSFESGTNIPAPSNALPSSSQPRRRWSFSSSPEVEMADAPPPPPSQPMPQFELYSDARLAGEVASYGFKAIKRREAMVALLKQCWVSKNGGVPAGAAAFSTSSAVGAGRKAASKATEVKSPKRARAKKDAEEEEPTKAKRARAKKDVDTYGEEEATKPKRARAKKDVASDPDEEPTKAKRPRAKKDAEEDAEEEPTKAKRARAKKDVASDSEEATTKPKRARAKKDATSDIDQEVTKPRRARAKRDVASDDEEETTKPKRARAKKDVASDSEEETTKPKRARVKKVTSDSEEEAEPKRSRVKKVTSDSEEETTKPKRARAKKDATLDDVAAVEEQPAKPKRGRPKKVVVQVEEPEKAKRGRPRKKKGDDDGDSETSVSGSPRKKTTKKKTASASPKPRRKGSASPKRKQSKSRSKSRSYSPETSILPIDQDNAFECMTRAIKAEAPTTDPARPSWHEQMLMYDAIVLEDLAAWLNTGPLSDAGWDHEVTPGDVKMWAQQRGVLCRPLAIEGKKGKKGKRGRPKRAFV